MSIGRKAAKKLRLFKIQGGKCYWCGIQMELTLHKQVTQWPTLATFEHLDDRFSPDRGKRAGERRLVLACHQCNHERGIKAQAAQPIEALRERAGRQPTMQEPA